MIEKIVRDYLLTALESIPVYVQLPKTLADTYVSIERTAGTITDHIRRATIAVQSVSPTMLGAIELHERVIAAMMEINSLDEIGAISLNSNYNFTDGDTGTYRYQAVFDLVYY